MASEDGFDESIEINDTKHEHVSRLYRNTSFTYVNDLLFTIARSN